MLVWVAVIQVPQCQDYKTFCGLQIMLTSSIRDSAVCCLHPRSPSFRRVSRENVVIIQHESWWAPLITKVENGAAVAPFWVSCLQMVVPDYLSNWLGDVWVGNLRAIDSPASWNQFTTPTFQPRIWSIERLQLARVMTQTTEGCFRWAQTPCGVRRCKAQSWWAVVLRRQVCGLRWCRGAADSWAEKKCGC